MNRSIRYASFVLALMFLAVAAITGYWQAMRGSALAAREDNPRRVLAERQIPRGAILDRGGHVLAVSQRTADGYVRYYPERSAAPVVGYYSLRYGLGGIESAFDAELRGVSNQTRWDVFADQLLHRLPAGHSVTLTIDLAVQQAADAALGERAGAVVVLSVPSGEVVAMVSHPTFDPAKLDQDWDRLRADPSSPLLNRAAQGSYQPGAAFQSVVLAEALSRGWVSLTDTIPATTPVALDDTLLECASTPVTLTVAAAFAVGCPAPLDALVGRLGASTVTDMVRQWQFNASPSFELPTHSSEFDPSTLTSTQAMRALVLGQGALTVSPLQMATVIGTIANNGRQIPAPHLTPKAQSASLALSVIQPEIASKIQSSLNSMQDQDLAGQSALAASGNRRLEWFLGFAPITSPHWVIVVLLESGDAATSRQIAVATLAKLSQ
jgi:peptidoglycan glycosyltransferase